MRKINLFCATLFGFSLLAHAEISTATARPALIRKPVAVTMSTAATKPGVPAAVSKPASAAVSEPAAAKPPTPVMSTATAKPMPYRRPSFAVLEAATSTAHGNAPAIWRKPSKTPRSATSSDLFEETAFRAVATDIVKEGRPVQRRRTGRARTNVLGLSAGAASATGRTVTLNLFPDVTLKATRTKIASLGDAKTWYGTVDGHARSRVSVTVYKGAMVGTVRFRGEPVGFGFDCTEKGDCQVTEKNFSLYKHDDGVDADAWQEKGDRINRTASAASPARIDAMILFTPDIFATGGTARSSTTMMAEINRAIIDANQSYVDSNVFITLSTVSITQTPNLNTTSMGEIRDRFIKGDVPGVHTLRDSVNADLVAIVTNELEGGCGQCAIQSDVTTGFAEKAYCVVQYSCLDNFSLAHEFGHAMGARHEWYEDDSDNSPFGFNHGYTDFDNRFGTIMSYRTECADRSRLGKHENGDQTGAVLAVGDFNGDGRMDVAAGSPGEAPGGDPESGVVYVFHSNGGELTAWGHLSQRTGSIGKNEKGDGFGTAVAAGDFNNDGFDDLAVGAPGEAPNDEPASGGVFVFHGSSTGLRSPAFLSQETGTDLGSNDKGDLFGSALVSGDFNNDGFADLAVGAPGEKPSGGKQSGAAYVYRGSSAGLVSLQGLTQETGEDLGSNDSGDEYGAALAAADFNGDGFDDLAIGAPGEKPNGDPKSGAVYIYRGTASQLTRDRGLTQSNSSLGKNELNDKFGFSLAAGDWNNDGRADLAVGAYNEKPNDEPRSGGVFLFRGTSAGLTADTFLSQETGSNVGTNEDGDQFGFSLTSGDFNGDGVADLAVGAPYEKPGSSPKGGAAYIFTGGASGVTPSTAVTQGDGGFFTESGDQFGWSLAAGDINSDGRADLLVGAPGEQFPDEGDDDGEDSGATSGSFYLFFGTPTASVILANSGQVLSQQDSTVSCPRENIWSNPDVLFGGAPQGEEGAQPADNARTLNLTAHTVANFRPMVVCDESENCALTQRKAKGSKNECGDDFGTAVAAGDFNGDGRMDVAIGAPGEAPGDDKKSGIVYVFNGHSEGLVQGVGITQETGSDIGSNDSGDKFGTALASGDFNGDGRTDLAIGAPGEKPDNGPESGAVFVYRGSRSGLVSDHGITQEKDGFKLGINENGDEYGAAVVAGDFNGDGFDDLAVGAPGEKPDDNPKSGAVFLYRGSSGGLTRDKSLTQAGLGSNENGDEFGTVLAAGDFNRDGYDDLAVGAPGEKPGDDPASGGVFVFHGSSTGLRTQAFLSQETGSNLGVNESGDKFGTALVAADFNNDGFTDLAVGAPDEKPSDEPRSGAVFVFKGSRSGLGIDRALTQETGTNLGSNDSGDEFGAALAAGDVNGDGIADLVVGAPGERPDGDPASGAIFVYRGATGGLESLSATQQEEAGVGNNESGDRFGASLAVANVDGAGSAEVIVGAPGEKPSDDPKSGAAYVINVR